MNKLKKTAHRADSVTKREAKNSKRRGINNWFNLIITKGKQMGSSDKQRSAASHAYGNQLARKLRIANNHHRPLNEQQRRTRQAKKNAATKV